jgi:NLR family CARD domain-containing protein 3
MNSLANGLKENHTILGIHMIGNEGSTDAYGFIKGHRNEDPGISHVFTRIDSINLIIKILLATLESGVKKNQNMMKMKAFSNCWICEGWSQMKFVYTPGVTSSRPITEYDNLYVHLGFENYEPDLLLPESDGTFYSLRMVPPGPLRYFFSVNEEAIIAENKPQLTLKKPAKTV